MGTDPTILPLRVHTRTSAARATGTPLSHAGRLHKGRRARDAPSELRESPWLLTHSDELICPSLGGPLSGIGGGATRPWKGSLAQAIMQAHAALQWRLPAGADTGATASFAQSNFWPPPVWITPAFADTPTGTGSVGGNGSVAVSYTHLTLPTKA